MAISNFRNRDDLVGMVLAVGDMVTFTVKEKELKYEVYSNFLELKGPGPNREVFNELGLDAKAIAGEEYGYAAPTGDWPSCKYDDMPALTRLVVRVYKEIEKAEKKPQFRVGDIIEFLTSASGCDQGYGYEAPDAPQELVRHGSIPKKGQTGVVKAICKESVMVEYQNDGRTMCLSFWPRAIKLKTIGACTSYCCTSRVPTPLVVKEWKPKPVVDQAALIEAGFMLSNGDLTWKGREELEKIGLEKHMAELSELAREVLKLRAVFDDPNNDGEERCGDCREFEDDCECEGEECDFY